MFVDASALVAMLAREPDHLNIARKFDSAARALVSPIVIYEATLATSRLQQVEVDEAEDAVRALVATTNSKTVTIDEVIGRAALEAFQRYGKGHHRARLNMGDCFAYACAKVHKVPLLCKGDDFVHTDVEIA